MKLFQKMFYPFSREAQYARLQKEMHEFLSQASDRYDLERLEREWDRANLHKMKTLLPAERR